MADDEKLERVAAEICYHVFGPWDRMADREKEKSRNAAKAAIGAMRSDPIPIHPTQLASPGIKGVAYIPEEGDVLGGASYGVRTNQARSVERQMEESERQRRRQAGEE